MTVTSVSILGSCRLEVAGNPVRLSPAQRRIVAALALAAPGKVSRDRLVDLLWQDDPPATAANTVQVHVSAIRRAAGAAGLIRGVEDGYSLDPAVAVDAHAFRADVAAGREAVTAGRWDEGATCLRGALSRWQSDPLADLADDPDARAAAAALIEDWLSGVEARSAADLARGEHATVAADLAGLAPLHPEREELASHFAVALFRSRRQLDALDWLRRHRRLLVKEYGVDPSPELRLLERRILMQDPALLQVARTRRDRIPALPEAPLGRQGDLSRVAELLRDPSIRLITVTGMGGIGKTTLALAVAKEVVADVAGGVVFVELADEFAAGALLVRVAAALDLAGRADVAALAVAIGPEPLLLVLDNLEQLSDAGKTVAALLAAMPGLTVLATSRRRLRIRGEHVHPLAPLALPDPDDPQTWLDNPAMAVFRRAAAAVAPGQAEGIEFERIAAAAVRTVDGIPLALELVAAWLRVLSPQGLADRLTRPLALLQSEEDDRPERHRSLSALLDGTLALIPEPAADLFARLSVLPSGARMDTVGAVLGPAVDPLPLMTELVDAQLLRRATDPDGEPRFTMLVPILEHAQACFAARADAGVVVARADEALVALLQAAEAGLRGRPDSARKRAVLAIELPWARAAIDRAIERGDTARALSLALPLHSVWGLNGYVAQGIATYDTVLAQPGGDPVSRARALGNAAQLTGLTGDPAKALDRARTAVSAAMAAGDEAVSGRAMSVLGASLVDCGNLSEAAEVLERAEALRTAVGDWLGVTIVRTQRALAALRMGDVTDAIRGFADAEMQLRELGMLDALGTAVFNRGMAAVVAGEGADAAEHLTQALNIGMEGEDDLVPYVLVAVSALVAAERPECTAWLAAAANAALHELDETLEPYEQGMLDGAVSSARAALGDEKLVAVWNAGQAATLTEAVAAARTVLDSLRGSSPAA